MLQNQQDLFSLPHEVTYLNCAYMAPQMRSIEEAGIEALRKKSNPTSITPRDFFKDTETLREEFSKLTNCHNPQRIVAIPSVSYGMANVARNISLEKGQRIVIVGEQFPSNYYCWHRLAKESGAELIALEAPDQNDGRGREWNTRILESIDNRTKVVALPHVHWADGTQFDLKQIRKRTNEVGALMIIDGTQSVGALPFDISEIEPDALICAGYKWLLGPYSLGLAYYGEAFDNGIPIEENWINRKDSEDFAGLVTYKREYQPGALRYEVGEHSNFNLIPMLLEAVKQLNEWGVGHIQSYCRDLTRPYLEHLKAHGYRIEDEPFRASHLFGVRMAEGKSVNKIRNRLSENNVIVSVRGDAIRVSPHLYNSPEDLQKLVGILTE